jgi:hypothetical protein
MSAVARRGFRTIIVLLRADMTLGILMTAALLVFLATR